MSTILRRRPGRPRVSAEEKTRRLFPQHGAATIADACDFLRCGKSTVYELLKLGRLKKVPLIKEARIPWSSLWAYIGDATQPVEQLERQIARLEHLVRELRNSLSLSSTALK